MSDLLLDIASNRRARQVVTTLGLPLPMPERLERATGAWEEQPLRDRVVVVGSAAGSTLGEALASTLSAAGADPWVIGDEATLAPWRAAGEAWGRPPHTGDTTPDRPWALVYDATGIRGPDDLRGLFDFFQPRIRGIGRSGRLVVIGRPPDSRGDAASAAAMAALDGFVRSAGREIGRRGATANLVSVEPGADDRLEPVLRFLLSPRAAYVSGQPWSIGKRVRRTAVRTTRPLEGKVVVVTGAARGIGEAIATVCAREGGRVVVVDRPEDDALGAEVARSIGGVYFACDVTADTAGESLAAFCKERFGRVDVIVHNAGITRDKMLANMKPELWDTTIGVNLDAPLRLTEALEPLLGRDARIVCLSSIAGIAGNVGQTNYAASKAGVIGLVRALGPRLAKKGIAINAIAPGFIETRLTHAIPVATREVARRLGNLGQGGLPIDVAETALFLSSAGAHGLSGQVIRVCGGSYVGA
jgi:3-oxoacyl-[acyl-carrier protein] reductase